jgi:hypoxanthine phosphoribosyltransferase
MMVDDWCRFLPREFDCIVGIPRSGLLIADQIALNFGLPLSIPDDFLRGVVWQSRVLSYPQEFKRVLVVDDCVGNGRDLTQALCTLKKAFPKTEFKSAALVKLGAYPLAFYYVRDDSFWGYGDLPKYQDGRVLKRRLRYDDFL